MCSTFENVYYSFLSSHVHNHFNDFFKNVQYGFIEHTDFLAFRLPTAIFN